MGFSSLFSDGLCGALEMASVDCRTVKQAAEPMSGIAWCWKRKLEKLEYGLEKPVWLRLTWTYAQSRSYFGKHRPGVSCRMPQELSKWAWDQISPKVSHILSDWAGASGVQCGRAEVPIQVSQAWSSPLGSRGGTWPSLWHGSHCPSQGSRLQP